MDAAKLLQCLLAAARVAAEVSRSERSLASVSFKPTALASNPHATMSRRIVTSGDFAAQEAVLQSFLKAGLQECRVLAEEETPSLAEFRPKPGRPDLFIDPIDGTLSFAVGALGWEDTAIGAGFSPEVVGRVKSATDPRMYGIVLGAMTPREELVSVCALPELGITYHSIAGMAFRNGKPLDLGVRPRKTRVVVSPRMLDADGLRSTPFQQAGLDTCLSGSHPAVLWRIFEGDCTAYANLSSAFDGQLASVIAAAAGLFVVDRQGAEFTPSDLLSRTDSLVFASTEEERDKICAVLRRYT